MRLAQRWYAGVVLAMGIICQTSGCKAGPDQRQDVSLPRHTAVHVLRSDQLTVEVMDPLDPHRYNRGVRFSPVAAVLSVRLDGHELLFNPIEHDPIADHGGLPAEFDLVAPGAPDDWMPPGYNEAKVGEGFIKIGVGVLRKEKMRYSLFQEPEQIAPAHITVKWHSDRAEFRQVCSGTDGYAYDLYADVLCKGDQIIVNWKLINTGRKTFTTRQYIHNFFRFDDHDVGPNYMLKFPYDFNATGLESQQRQIGRDIRFDERIPKWINMVVPFPSNYYSPNVCTLQQTDVKLAVTCETSIPSIRTAIHARLQYVSPEQFIELTLGPTESKRWTRSYRFESLP
ncbi:MAG: hypothetical protein ACYC26_16910 [Phycisphaerales bacterium]